MAANEVPSGTASPVTKYPLKSSSIAFFMEVAVWRLRGSVSASSTPDGGAAWQENLVLLVGPCRCRLHYRDSHRKAVLERTTECMEVLRSSDSADCARMFAHSSCLGIVFELERVAPRRASSAVQRPEHSGRPPSELRHFEDEHATQR